VQQKARLTMKKAAILAVFVLAMAAVLVAAYVLAARNGVMAPSEAALRTRYGHPQSKFLTIDGQLVHYIDEGSGPPVVLVHGSYGSLRMWDSWAGKMVARHRVIRFDRPGMGLSGPAPNGRYDAATEANLIGALTESLGVPRFDLAATSSAGEAAAAFAAGHPDRVRGIILANIAAGPIPFRPIAHRWSYALALAADRYLAGWHMQAFWREILIANFADASKVTPEMVREWTELNNRAQFYKRQPRAPDFVPFKRTPADLAAMRAPTLLIWSDRDPEVPAGIHGRETMRLLGSTDKRLILVRNCGHMMPLECGPESAAVAISFLDMLDTSVRSTAAPCEASDDQSTTPPEKVGTNWRACRADEKGDGGVRRGAGIGGGSGRSLNTRGPTWLDGPRWLREAGYPPLAAALANAFAAAIGKRVAVSL
jgi:pimeloyl-ACP methyl ester carboxylesterase